NSSSIADGIYDVRVVAVDAFGNQASDTRTGITFDNTAPQLAASTPEDGALLPAGSTISALSLTASEPLQSVTGVKVDGQSVLAAPVITGAAVNVPLDAPVADGLHTFTGRLTDAAGKSSTFRITTTILASPGSFTPPTMDWSSNGDPVHLFRLPLAITMSDPTGGLAIPATFQNGAWRLIPMLSSPVLPVGQQDGFYRDATGVHVLTTHLTLFTLVRDVQ